VKKVIKNKVYDTETAKFCGKGACEQLFQKKTGEFFLYKENSRKIAPLSYTQAQEWGENHLPKEAFSSVFGNEENPDRVKICISIRKDIHIKLKQNAARCAKTVSKYIEDLLNEYHQ
jgi:hypothetical protein